MYRLGQCKLIYINQSQDEDFNPVIKTYARLGKCKLMDAFSVNYYQSQTRDMRKAKNIIIAKPYTFDVEHDDRTYRLEYVEMHGIKYKVTNILIDRNSSLTSILDCEQVINE